MAFIRLAHGVRDVRDKTSTNCFNQATHQQNSFGNESKNLAAT